MGMEQTAVPVSIPLYGLQVIPFIGAQHTVVKPVGKWSPGTRAAVKSIGSGHLLFKLPPMPCIYLIPGQAAVPPGSGRQASFWVYTWVSASGRDIIIPIFPTL